MGDVSIAVHCSCMYTVCMPQHFSLCGMGSRLDLKLVAKELQLPVQKFEKKEQCIVLAFLYLTCLQVEVIHFMV